MNVTVVYESMFGNTRLIAEKVAQGIARPLAERPNRVVVRHVAEVTLDGVLGADLLVVGAPTHANGLSRPLTRTEASTWGADPETGLTLEPAALGTGVREWLETLPHGGALFAAFDTRADLPKRFSGFASRAVASALASSGRQAVLEPESFLVTTDSRPERSELERANVWGELIAHAAAEIARSRGVAGTDRDGVTTPSDPHVAAELDERIDASLEAEFGAEIDARAEAGIGAAADELDELRVLG